MTSKILIITLILSILGFQQPKLIEALIFNPVQTTYKKQWYRFITSAFIHADWLHLAVNMFVLYSFGPFVESCYDSIHGEKGGFYFLMLYLLSAGASIMPSYFKHKQNPLYNALGASGATSAVVFTAVLFNPWQKLLLFAVLPIPGIVFAIAYLAYSYYQGKKANDNINHDAHFWGAVFGFGYTILLKPLIILYFVAQLMNPRF